MLVAYTKMNGLKNDFVVFEGPLKIHPEKIIELCSRRTGIGADGVLVVSKQESGPKMEYWNSDGSKAEMCGNGLRCAARFAVKNKYIDAGKFIIQTPAGPLRVICNDDDQDEVEAQVGKVITDPSSVTLEGLIFYTANVGNPHAITFVDNVSDAPVASVGAKVERNEYFPNKTNVEFVEIVDSKHLKIRVWERGVGETLACGTGMVAAAVVSSQQKNTGLPAVVEVKGGTAQVWIDDDGYARMRGPVEIMSEGQVEV